MQAKHIKATIGLSAALLAGVALVAASGAGAAKAPRTARIDVSTKAAVVHYLRSIHVSPKGVVIQRGIRNYAGPNCPGKRWTCASALRTVVQVAKPGGKNIFRCGATRCAVVQISKSPLATNSAMCVKTTGGKNSCSISQPNSAGTNKAVVWMDSGKLSGLTQTAVYTASITQGPASATGSSNTNLACVHQLTSIDGSTVSTTNAGTTVTSEAHQSISISQNSLTGDNTVENAQPAGPKSYDCDASHALLQSQTLASTAISKGVVIQKQNAVNNGPNLTLDIAQNQGSGFLNNPGVTGANTATSEQIASQTAIANTPAGATQIQTSPTGGVLAAVNQYSQGLSTASARQQETQCEDADVGGLSTCDTADQDPPANYNLTQIQYGPAGLGKSAAIRHGRHFQTLRKAIGDSSQTGNDADTFVISQVSHQDNDTNSGQSNVVQGGIATDGTGTVTQDTLIQGAPKKNVHQGDDTTVNGNINCAGSSCSKDLAAPEITAHPTDPAAYGSTSFSFKNVDPTVTFVCKLDTGSYGPCTSVTRSANGTFGTQTYSNLASGSHTFSVETQDPDNGNVSVATSFTWVITPPVPTIDPTSAPTNPTRSTSASFTFSDADPSALFKCQLDNGGYTACASPASYTGLSLGQHTFEVKATDSSGTYESVSPASFTWTVARHL
jgi:hypothetical protein